MHERRLSLIGRVGAVALLVACEHGGDAADPHAPAAPSEAAVVPSVQGANACAPCHADHVTQWSGSMHAYASDDPVFVAMSARAMRETAGKIGNLCVSCHAPMAVRAAEGKLVDPKSLPQDLRGVGCTSCHSVSGVIDLHDGALRYAGDGTFRGPIADPMLTSAHTSTYSSLHDRTTPAGAALCGSCHDVRMPNGADLERTFAEWTTTAFSHPDFPGAKTCGGCHMPGSQGAAATVPNAPVRIVHDHTMAALDVALTAFPETAAQKKAVQLALDSAIQAKLCVPSEGQVQVSLANGRIGHAWPSGATHDRRAWAEVVAFTNGAKVWSRGAENGDFSPDPAKEPDALLLGGTLLDAEQNPVHFLWQATQTRVSALAPRLAGEPGAVPRVATYTVPAGVDRVTLRLRVTPYAREVLDDLVTSGDLDAAVLDAVPTFTLASTVLEWTADRGFACLP